jgi:enoyl-[acyl-carrier protein] reductase III
MASGSTILAVSSLGARRAVPFYSLVGSSKGALESLVRHLACELASRGVRVNTLCPGSVPTDAWKAVPDGENLIEASAQRSPLGRLITPEEVAWAAQFLCSQASQGIVGHTLVVDGGLSLL